ncbi:MAG: site-specific tyrosine recombinase XerC [Planctomycetia bacterium]|nr:site-specific tyrosine recombinase XerC [Planctomycetia bacterium]
MPHKRKPASGNPDDPQGMAVLLARYLEWLAVKNFARRTVEIRRVCVDYFIEWSEQRGIVRPSEVTRPILERYQRYLYYYRKKDGEPLSVRSQISRLMALRAWFAWLAKERRILFNPAGELEMPKLEYRLPKTILTAREAEQVIALPKLTDPLGLRDRAVLETLYSTGMRRMELVRLSVYDLDADRGTVMIRQGKGKKDRMIPIGERALAWINRYLHEVRPGLLVGDRSGDTLFLTERGEPFHPCHLSKMIRDYVKAADVGKKGSCHLFRHTMATLMHDNGADIRFVQAMLGHAKLDTTMVYTQVAIKKLKEIHTATHPARMQRQPRPEHRNGQAQQPTTADEEPADA